MKETVLLVRPYYGINIHTDAQGDYGTILDSNDIFPDLPLINAATILERSDKHEVIVIDAAAERMLPDKLIEKALEYKYDKVIVKAAAPSVRSDLELVRRLKSLRPESYVMIAGHAAQVLKDWIYKNTDADYVIDEPLDEYVYRYVNGSSGGINDFPVPDYSLVDHTKYTDDNGNIRLTLQASRGCHMGCSYCPYIQYYQGYLCRDIDKVIDDIKTLTALGADVIQFRDQFFTCDRERIVRLCERMISEGISVRWICETRLDSLDKELIGLMRRAGLFLICFGVESGNEDILNIYNSGKGDLRTQKETVDHLRSQGILTMAFYIVGFPEDTWDSVMGTYRYAERMGSDIADFNEYIDFDFSSVREIDPGVFRAFDNSTRTGRPSRLNGKVIRYIVELFETMYTLRRDTLEKAYGYNHVLFNKGRELAAEISGCADDLDQLSEIVRARREIT